MISNPDLPDCLSTAYRSSFLDSLVSRLTVEGQLMIQHIEALIQIGDSSFRQGAVLASVVISAMYRSD